MIPKDLTRLDEKAESAEREIGSRPLSKERDPE
jgi:hypothetical protein